MKKAQSIFLNASLLAPLAVAIKLSFANVCIIPAVGLYLYFSKNTLFEALRSNKAFFAPLGVFLFVIWYSSLFGLDVQTSLRHAGKLSYMLLLIPLYADLFRKGHLKNVLLFLTLGLSIAATHTVFESAMPGVLFEYAHGPVSEAGQLGIGIFAALALFFLLGEFTSSNAVVELGKKSLIPFFGFVVLGFSPHLPLHLFAQYALFAACIAFLIFHFARFLWCSRQKNLDQGMFVFVASVAIPLIAAAIVLNLKRGPWLGVTGGAIVLLLMTRPKLLLIGMPLILALLFGFDPVRDRAFSSFEHFMMLGGRGEIWTLGAELLIRYPLGIGLENAQIIKDFSLNIPANLNHFHSNLINIAVELGWLGLTAYLWWIVTIFCFGLALQKSSASPTTENHREHLATISLTCGIISWQIAGLFEYNFGDSEVFLIAMIVIGLIAGLRTARTQTFIPKATTDLQVAS